MDLVARGEAEHRVDHRAGELSCQTWEEVVPADPEGNELCAA